MKITIEQVISLGPCTNRFPYRDPAYIRDLFGSKDSIEHREVLLMDRVPAADKEWVLRHLLETTDDSERDLRLYACDCAERALRRERSAGREPAMASWRAVEVARRFANGVATRGEPMAAWAAAEVEAMAAAEVAAMAAAEVAAMAAAWAAAWAARAADAVTRAAWAENAAADAAAWASRAAAWAATRAAWAENAAENERLWQVERLCWYLDRGGDE